MTQQTRPGDEPGRGFHLASQQKEAFISARPSRKSAMTITYIKPRSQTVRFVRKAESVS